MITQDLYDKYLLNKKEIWKNHFTWNGLFGGTPKNTINLTKYFYRNKSFFEGMSNVKNVISYRNFLKKEVKNYIAWVSLIEPTYTDEEKDDISRFFVGTMGEVFFFCLLQSKVTFVMNKATYTFRNVAPILYNDFGVDGTCSYSNSIENKEIECAIQVKFWEPFADVKLPLKVVQGTYGQAVADTIIDPKENRNVLICWLGDDSKVSRFIEKDTSIEKHLIFMDMKVLDSNINDKVPFFWKEQLPKFLKNII